MVPWTEQFEAAPSSVGKAMRLLLGLAILAVLNLWSSSAFATDVYAIQENGDMLFYKHAGVDDGSATWPISGKKIGNGWNFKQVSAGFWYNPVIR